MTEYKYKQGEEIIRKNGYYTTKNQKRIFLALHPERPETHCIIYDHGTGETYSIALTEIEPKPKTRTINGIEVPAPITADFNFKVKHEYFFISPFTPTKIDSVYFNEFNHRFAATSEMLYHSGQDAKENLQAIESTAQAEK